MRTRAAVTETKGAKSIENAVTSIHLEAKVVSTAIGNAADVQVWVGRATFEGAMRDSMTDVRLPSDSRYFLPVGSGLAVLAIGLPRWSRSQ